MKQTAQIPDHQDRESVVVGKAVIKAADRLKVPAGALASIVGLSEPTISRLKRGSFFLAKNTKPFELAVLFIRLFRSLDAIVGGDEAVARAWLINPNTALGGKPLELIQTVSGLVNVIGYLDARRAVV